MKIVTKNITVIDEILTLTNQRAVFWVSESVLILSDIHIGKTAHFRKHGIPIPEQILQNDLHRLEELIKHFSPEKIVIVGDLFHAEHNNDVKIFKDWMTNFNSLKWILVKGNHDRLSKSLLKGFEFEIFNEYTLNPFTFIHDDNGHTIEKFTISGHIHPGVFIKGKGRQSIKLPCYQVTKNQLILPAFSLFTGLNTREIPEEAICYAFTDEGIFEA